MPTRDINLAKTGGRWSFVVDGEVSLTKTILAQGETLVLSARVRNDGLEIGTVYVWFFIADCLSEEDLYFDSHRDLSTRARHALRFVDIPIGGTQEVACAWTVPRDASDSHLHVRMQVWSPQPLYNGPDPYLFSDTGWVCGFFVVGKTSQKKNIVFVSYSWDGADHERWVRELVGELKKYDIDCILDKDQSFAGDEISHFIERGLKRSTAVLLICSKPYTEKANPRRKGGVGFETVLYSSEYIARTPRQRARFIPIVRNNNLERKIPKYLGSAKYIDMSGDHWRAAPMLELVQSIKRRSRGHKT